MDRNNYLQLRNKYFPRQLRHLFVLESPPASGKYFYDENGEKSEPLFVEMMRFLGYRARNKKDGLKRFSEAGYFLVDAIYEPVNELKGKKRDENIMEGFSLLVEDLESIDASKSVPIILVKANVCKLLEEPLKKKGFNVINNGITIPYPSTGQQKRFHQEIGKIHNANRTDGYKASVWRFFGSWPGVVALLIGLLVVAALSGVFDKW